MKVLENDNILKTLDLPTIDWKPYNPEADLQKDIFWTIKVEEIPDGKEKDQKPRKTVLRWLRKRNERTNPIKRNGLIGIHAEKAKEYGDWMYRRIDPAKQMVLYYPYYTVVKSGILDLNGERVVIEGTNGDINNMLLNSKIEVTMILTEDDVEVFGDERFFRQEEFLSLIDYSKEVRKMAARDIADGKNIQLMFSLVYRTSDEYKPEGELQLIFHRFKLF